MPSREHTTGVFSNIESLVAQFIAKTLPKPEWTHEAHLCVGLWHVMHFGAEPAMSLLRERIRSYNESVGTQNTETSGYHETITRFYVLMIGKFLSQTDRNQSVDQLATQLIARYGSRELPLQYYSLGLLFSPTARMSWAEPDLRNLD